MSTNSSAGGINQGAGSTPVPPTSTSPLSTTPPDTAAATSRYYQGVISLPPGGVISTWNTGFPLVNYTTQFSTTFTPIRNFAVSLNDTLATISTPLPLGLITTAEVVYNVAFPGVAGLSTFFDVTFTSYPLKATPAPTPTATTSNESSSNSTRPTDTRSESKTYSRGTLAGAAVGCALGAVLLTALSFLFCMRKRRKHNNNQSRERHEKHSPLLSDHGEAVYLTHIGAQPWEKHLPQAESDVTIRAMTSRTLDQIAMHVENFYSSGSNVMLSTEHQFELETIDCSPLSEPISTMLLRSQRTEELIKHYISCYILSMISFDEGTSNGGFLPKVFRKQWQRPPNDVSAITQAYSKWRVLTAYLRQQTDEEQTYMTERDAIIDTAAQHVCKAFEPWAKPDADLRLQNLVGIMKRASELGIQLFSQPAKFEWQWQRQPPRRSGSGVRASSLKEVVILPGLSKTTDQHAVPLTDPIRLIEPVIVSVKNL